MENKILCVIPARGGSKGIPNKNIKEFAGKPLICHSIDIARKFASDQDICISTDDSKIIDIVHNYGLQVPFIRPVELATDTATTNDVLLHAVEFYKKNKVYYDKILLLQPTSPLRQESHVSEAIACYSNKIDMVVSVNKSDVAGVLCEENEDGLIVSIFNKNHLRRQDTKDLYVYNGAIYVINIESLIKKGFPQFDKKIKYVMPLEYSIDIDTHLDWLIAETLYEKIKQ